MKRTAHEYQETLSEILETSTSINKNKSLRIPKQDSRNQVCQEYWRKEATCAPWKQNACAWAACPDGTFKWQWNILYKNSAYMKRTAHEYQETLSEILETSTSVNEDFSFFFLRLSTCANHHAFSMYLRIECLPRVTSVNKNKSLRIPRQDSNNYVCQEYWRKEATCAPWKQNACAWAACIGLPGVLKKGIHMRTLKTKCMCMGRLPEWDNTGNICKCR